MPPLKIYAEGAEQRVGAAMREDPGMNLVGRDNLRIGIRKSDQLIHRLDAPEHLIAHHRQLDTAAEIEAGRVVLTEAACVGHVDSSEDFRKAQEHVRIEFAETFRDVLRVHIIFKVKAEILNVNVAGVRTVRRCEAERVIARCEAELQGEAEIEKVAEK